MAATGFWYGLAAKDQWGATAADRVDWVTDTIKVSLHTVTYVPNQDTDQYFTAATNEVTGTNYTASGVTLGTKTLTYDGPTNTVRFKSADAVWSNVTITSIRIAVIYKSTGVAGTSHLLGWINLGADQSPAGVNFTITPDATDGWLRAVVS